MINCIEKADFRILKTTQCRHLNHMWIWTGGSASEKPPEEAKCDCGLWTWAEWGKAAREIADD